MPDKKTRPARPQRPAAGSILADTPSRRTTTTRTTRGGAPGGKQPGRDNRPPKQSWWKLIRENLGWGLIIGLPILIVVIALLYRATDGFHFTAQATQAPLPTVAPTPTAGTYVAPPAPAANAQRNQIAYLSSPDATKPQQIYVANPDGSNPVKLTDSPEIKASPVWSPDGKQIAFTASGVGIQIVNFDGSGLHTLAYNGFAPAWSPDGKQLAFLRSESATDGKGPDGVGTVRILYITKADGKPGDEQQLAYDAMNPVWSPDGKEIMYFSLRNLVAFTVEAKQGGVALQVKMPNNLGVWYPTYTPDGKSIIFYGTPNANYLANSLDQNATFLTPTATGQTPTATPTTTAPPTANGSVTPAPTATATPSPTPLPNSITNLYIVGRDGTNLKTLAQVEDNTGVTTGSLFAAYVNNAADGVPILTSRPYYSAAPVLSPDGKNVAALLVTKDSVGIQVVPTDGSNQPVKILGKEGNLEAGSRLSPSFSADGTKLYYIFQPPEKDKPIVIRSYDLASKTETPFVKDGTNGFPVGSGFKK